MKNPVFKPVLFQTIMPGGVRNNKGLWVPAFWKAVKPRRRTFRKAIKMMGLKTSQVAVIGDQVFTDILENRLGLHTILVHPLNKQEYISTMCVENRKGGAFWFKAQRTPEVGK